MLGITVVIVYLCSILYVETRGKERHSRMFRLAHHNVLAPINCLFYLFSGVPSKQPFVDLERFPELDVLKREWHTIREEAINLNKDKAILASNKLDDVGFRSFFKEGWKRFYLKWYGTTLQSAEQLCPKTTALLNSIPSVKGGMFAMLPPGSRLRPHTDPYAGSLRYHLGIQTPNHEDCFIAVDGQRYVWRDGDAVIFDETYIHWAENNTDQNRIVLFLDIKRPVTFFLVDWFNIAFSKLVMSATVSKNAEGDKVGGINRIFQHAYRVRTLFKRLKDKSRPAYYLVQILALILILYLLLF